MNEIKLTIVHYFAPYGNESPVRTLISVHSNNEKVKEEIRRAIDYETKKHQIKLLYIYNTWWFKLFGGKFKE